MFDDDLKNDFDDFEHLGDDFEDPIKPTDDDFMGDGFDTDPQQPPKFVEPLAWYQIWWQAISQPTEESYEQLLNQPDTTAERAYLWIAAVSIITSLIMIPLLSIPLLSLDTSAVGILLCGIPAFALFSIIVFVIGTTATYGTARLFGGKGTYGQHAFMYAAVSAPLTIASITSVIPLLGSCISILISFYSIFVVSLAIKTTHQFDWGRAIASLLLWVGGIFLLIFCGTIMMLVLLGPQIGNVFSGIQEGLLTPVP